jgi:hypothetical protein
VSYKSISSESRGNRFGTAQIVAILSWCLSPSSAEFSN